MTIVEFRDLVVTSPQATFVTIEAVTEPAWLSRKGEYVGKVMKRSRVNGVIYWGYELAVNRQRAREGKEPDFESYPRAWGERVPRTPFVQHKGSLYLEMKVERALSTEFFARETGQPVDAATIYPLLRTPSAGRQGVDKAVIIRDYAMCNIRTITYLGITHTLE